MVSGGHERKPLIGMHFTAGAERIFLLKAMGKGGRKRLVSSFRVIFIQ